MPRSTAQPITTPPNTVQMTPARRMTAEDQFVINTALAVLQHTTAGDVSKAVRRVRTAAAQTIHRLLLPPAVVSTDAEQDD